MERQKRESLKSLILRAHIEALEAHVARLEGIVHVMLEEASPGPLEEAASEILKELPRIDSE